MGKSRYIDSQIPAILKQNEEGAKVPDLCREHGMSAPLLVPLPPSRGTADTSMSAGNSAVSFRGNCSSNSSVVVTKFRTRTDQAHQYLITTHARVIGKKLLNRITATQVVKQSLDRHSCTRKHWCTADDIRIDRENFFIHMTLPVRLQDI